MADSKTVTPQLAYLDIAPDALYHETYTSFTKVADEFITELETAYDHHKTKHTSDPIIEEANFFANLNDTLLMNFNGDFLLFWLDKYHTAHDAVKFELDAILGENNVFFKDFNESMGCLRHAAYVKDRSTISTLDTDSVITDTNFVYNGSTTQILHYESQFVSLNLSKFTDSVFKQNIRHIGDPQSQKTDGTTGNAQTHSSSTKTHGLNLVPDYEHYKRMTGLAADIVRVVNDDLKDLKNALIFLSTFVEEQSVFKETIEINIEDVMIKVGFLKNKLINTDEVTTASPILNSSKLSIDDNTQPNTKDIKDANTDTSSSKAKPNLSEEPTVEEVLGTAEAKKKLEDPSNKEKVVIEDSDGNVSTIDKDEYDLDHNIFTETSSTLGEDVLDDDSSIVRLDQIDFSDPDPEPDGHPCDILNKMLNDKLQTWADSKGKIYSLKEIETACLIVDQKDSLDAKKLNNDQSKKPIQKSHTVEEPSTEVIFKPDYTALYNERDSTTIAEIIFTSSKEITDEFKQATGTQKDNSFGSYYPSGKIFQVKAYVYIDQFQVTSDDGSIVEMLIRTTPQSIPTWSTMFMPFYQQHSFSFEFAEGGIIPTQKWIDTNELMLIKGHAIRSRGAIDHSLAYLSKVQRQDPQYMPTFY